MHIPGSSKCVKFVPFHPKNLPKNRNFTYMEDQGLYNNLLHTHINPKNRSFSLVDTHGTSEKKTFASGWWDFGAFVGGPHLMEQKSVLRTMVILLMEEILHHLGYINLVNNGINYISTGAGFLPSTVW